jgi:hypothetical protein
LEGISVAYIPYRSFVLEVGAPREETFERVRQYLDRKETACEYCGRGLPPKATPRYCVDCGYAWPGQFRLKGLATRDGFQVKLVRREVFFLRPRRFQIQLEGWFEAAPGGTRIPVRILPGPLELVSAGFNAMFVLSLVWSQCGAIGLLWSLPGLVVVYCIVTAYFRPNAEKAQDILTRLCTRPIPRKD